MGMKQTPDFIQQVIKQVLCSFDDKNILPKYGNTSLEKFYSYFTINTLK